MAETIELTDLEEWAEEHALTGDEIRIVDTDVNPEDVVAEATLET